MSRIIYLLFFLILYNCSFSSNNNKVYWCGDHPCINKKERQAYFKKNMVVEVKKIDKKETKNSELEKIMNQARKNEKKRIASEKLSAKKIKHEEKLRIQEEKLRIKEEKELDKKIRLDEKKRIKEEEKLAKKILSDEKKKIIKRKEKDIKPNKKVVKKSLLQNDINLNKSLDSFELLKKKNSSRKFLKKIS